MIVAGLHRPIALVRADSRLGVRFGVVHGNLQEVRSQPMEMRVRVGEQTTLEEQQPFSPADRRCTAYLQHLVGRRFDARWHVRR